MREVLGDAFFNCIKESLYEIFYIIEQPKVVFYYTKEGFLKDFFYDIKGDLVKTLFYYNEESLCQGFFYDKELDLCVVFYSYIEE